MQEENSIAPAQELLGLVRESQNMTRREASKTRRKWDSGLSYVGEIGIFWEKVSTCHRFGKKQPQQTALRIPAGRGATRKWLSWDFFPRT